MLCLSEDQVQKLLPMKECVEVMRQTFTALSEGRAQTQPRRRLRLPSGAMLHQMAGAYGNYFGTKVYSAHAKYGAYFTFLLYDAATAEPLAQFEANALGQIRTGAASGLATDLMASKGAHRMGLIGSGFQAWTQLEAMLAVRPIDTVRVYSRNAQRRVAFALRASETFAVDVRSVDSAEAACEEAEILVTSTYAKDPVIQSAWVLPGTHINAMGSNHAERRELPTELIGRARRIGIDSLEQSKLEAGDLLLAVPVERWNELPLVELAAWFSNQPLAERAGGDVTIFNSLGLGVEDVAAAAYVFERWVKEKGRP